MTKFILLDFENLLCIKYDIPKWHISLSNPLSNAKPLNVLKNSASVGSHQGTKASTLLSSITL